MLTLVKKKKITNTFDEKYLSALMFTKLSEYIIIIFDPFEAKPNTYHTFFKLRRKKGKSGK